MVVLELNQPPALTLPPSTNVDELEPYNASASATDPDIPGNPLTFTLVSGPAGLTVSPSGAISWTPTEAQGPSTNVVIISVTDTNADAINEKALSTTNSFTLVVNEVNSAPVLSPISERTIHAGVQLSLTATASDPDIPANNLTFELLSGPTGVEVSTNGSISWPTTDADASSTNAIELRVFDNGLPTLSDTQSFQVIVISRPVLAAPLLSNNVVTLSWSAIPETSYRLQYNTDLNVSAWSDVPGDITAASTNVEKSDSVSTSRWYRVRVLP